MRRSRSGDSKILELVMGLVATANEDEACTCRSCRALRDLGRMFQVKAGRALPTAAVPSQPAHRRPGGR